MVTAKRKASAKKGPASRRVGRVQRPSDYQIQNTKSRRHDDMRRAKAPGKRTSKTGRVYYERRSNRSDIQSEVDAYERYVKAREELRKRKEATKASTKKETKKVQKSGTKAGKKRSARGVRRAEKTTQATL